MIASLMLAAALAAPSITADSDAVVAVYALQGNHTAAQGTGFFVRSGGHIITCYHVIRGATALQIYHKGRAYNNVRIEAVAPQYDLAMIRVENMPPHPVLRIADEPADAFAGEQLRVIGWPRNQDNSTLYGRMTMGSLTHSTRLRNARSERIFRIDIPVITLDVTTENGVSGAPVVSSRGVIGVLSGSYNVGHGIAWVIPIADVRQMQQLGTPVAAPTMHWPPFELLFPDKSEGLRAFYSYSAGADLFFLNVQGMTDTLHVMLKDLSSAATASLARIAAVANADSSYLRELDAPHPSIEAIGLITAFHNLELDSLQLAVSTVDSINDAGSDVGGDFETDTLVARVERSLQNGSESPEATRATKEQIDRIHNLELLGDSLSDRVDSLLRIVRRGRASLTKLPLPTNAEAEARLPSAHSRSQILAELEYLNSERELQQMYARGVLIDATSEILDLVAKLHEWLTFSTRLDVEDVP